MTTLTTPSVMGIMLELLNNDALVMENAPSGATYGPADNDQQQAGVISVTEGGLAEVDRSGLTLRQRFQLRCLAPTIEQGERIHRAIYQLLHGRGRRIVRDGTGSSYLVHSTMVNGGPTTHRDSTVTWEELLYAEALVGTMPVN